MTLTTHDWAVFFSLAVTQSPNGAEVAQKCVSMDALREICTRLAKAPCASCDAELNAEMLDTLRHLIVDHGLQPVPRGAVAKSPLLRSLAPYFFNVHRWIENYAPEMRA